MSAALQAAEQLGRKPAPRQLSRGPGSSLKGYNPLKEEEGEGGADADAQDERAKR